MLSVLAVTVVWVMMWHNLVSNSVYYAKHMPHKEGSEPMLVMIMDNHFWLSNVTELIYRQKGNFTISNGIQYISTFDYSNSSGYYFHNINAIYEFDRIFQLTFAYKRDTVFKDSLDLTTIDQKKMMSEIYELVQPIIDAQKSPTINLQWLFNLLNYSRFN